MMKSLPSNVAAYKRTDVFTQTSVPMGLLSNHRTLQDVWGKIVVLEGKLIYVIGEHEYVLTPEQYGVVEPQVIHCVRPEGEVSFYVEFYR